MTDQPSKVKQSVKRKTKRCCQAKCKKKLTLTDMPCRCTLIFCTKHRLPEQHNCCYDFKIENAEEFMKRVGLGGGDYTKVEVI